MAVLEKVRTVFARYLFLCLEGQSDQSEGVKNISLQRRKEPLLAQG